MGILHLSTQSTNIHNRLIMKLITLSSAVVFAAQLTSALELAKECVDWEKDSRGLEYEGTQSSVSDESGEIKCASWNFDQHTTTHWKTGLDFKPNHNYCRNPDVDPNGPWCYRADFDFGEKPGQEGQEGNYVYCKEMIPQCKHVTKQSSNIGYECPPHSYQIFYQTLTNLESNAESNCGFKAILKISDGTQLEWPAESRLTTGKFKKWMVGGESGLKTCAGDPESFSVVPACGDDWYGRIMIKTTGKNEKVFWQTKLDGNSEFWVGGEEGEEIELELLEKKRKKTRG